MKLHPCNHCGAPATVTGPDPETGGYFVECSNRIDCEIWPATANHPTPEEAAAEWETES